MDEQRPHLQWAMWKRFLLAALAVVALTAAATATIALERVSTLANEFFPPRSHISLGNVITPSQAGAPQTILLIGSDKRAQSKTIQDRTSPPHSDTLLLIRMDPNKDQTSVLSIPRDLKVTIDPPKATPSVQKINAAYSIGGAKLATATVRRVLHIEINHVVDVNFRGFRRVIDAIGCVYVYVDRYYYHSNAGLGFGQQYAEINIHPGYQKLCGQTALDYARYRHTDSDFVRVARQQDFIRQAKEQVGVQGLIDHVDRIAKAVGSTIQTDIHGTVETLRLTKLVAFSLGRPVRQVHFQAYPGPSYVTATPREIRRTVADFLQTNAKPQVRAPVLSAAVRVAKQHGGGTGGVPGLSIAPASERAQARPAAVRLGFPLYYPRLRVQSGFAPADVVRRYDIADERGRLHHAYVVSIDRGIFGQYEGLQGTDWKDPPILRNAKRVRVGGRSYQFVFDGAHLHVVAWHAHGAVYWINNTLLDSLTNAQMLAMAAGAQPLR